MATFKNKTNGDYEVEIVQDEDSESPRDWDNLGTMVCFHGRHSLGDKHDFKSPEDFQEFLAETRHISLPLYLYDHSGITMNTTGFSCRFDSGQVGVIYITVEKAVEEFGKDYDKEKILSYLKNEVTTYDQFLTGEVYGYVLKKLGEEVDSCWGYYGDDPSKNGMTENFGDENGHIPGEWVEV